MSKSWGVVDLFSGAGGMSFGFRANPAFRMLAAVDFEIGKPSYGPGALECNQTYRANMGIEPMNRDIAKLSPLELEREIKKLGAKKSNVDILISCAPCTGFSRTNSNNHVKDDPRNSLVTRSALFVEHFKPRIFLMENARELLRGNFTHHFLALQSRLERLGYRVHAQNYFLNQFGLPQKRERALVVATQSRLPLYSLDDLWDGFALKPQAMTVRRAIAHLPKLSAGETHPSDALHVCPRFSDSVNLNRIAAIPHNGGSWVDLLRVPGGRKLLTPAMARSAAKKDFGSHPDVYGRLSWDKPAVTVKRECGHIGNGRYGHPDQDRLLSVREMSLIQGFPSDYVFAGRSISNMYRHIGDAVPPLISFQLSKLCEWILDGRRPALIDVILAKTHLLPSDIVPRAAAQPGLPFSATG